VPLIVFKGAAKSPHIKAHLLFRLAQKSHLTAVGCKQQAEHPTDQPAEQQWRQLLHCAVAFDGGSSRHHVRRNVADRFRPVVRRQIQFVCELVNIAQRLNSRKIHVTPPTRQHAIGHVTIVQMSQDQKNSDDEQF